MAERIPLLAERDGQLVENWYIACLDRELTADQPIGRMIYDKPLVLFRDENGRAACLPDRCLHRHAQLSKGVSLSGKVGCPYHGWVYNSHGQVVEIPSEGPGEPGSRTCTSTGRKLCLKPYPVVEQDGCVWVWTGEGEPRSPKPPFRFPHFDDRSWASYFMITDFDNEVTHLAENFMDVPHTVFVHAGWFRNPSLKQVPISVETSQGSVLVTYRQPADQIGVLARWLLNPSGEPMSHTDRFILPNITKVDYDFGSRNSFVIISQCTPVSTLECRVYTAIIYRVGAMTRILKPFFQFYTRRVIEQDVDIMKIQSRNLKLDPRLDFHATDADVVHTAIEKLRDLAARGDPTASSRQAREERTIWI
jgi:phenylpropionate dioxygenase-like ring-hydroxylating dioxygenase large terminal subunit